MLNQRRERNVPNLPGLPPTRSSCDRASAHAHTTGSQWTFSPSAEERNWIVTERSWRALTWRMKPNDCRLLQKKLIALLSSCPECVDSVGRKYNVLFDSVEPSWRGFIGSAWQAGLRLAENYLCLKFHRQANYTHTHAHVPSALANSAKTTSYWQEDLFKHECRLRFPFIFLPIVILFLVPALFLQKRPLLIPFSSSLAPSVFVFIDLHHLMSNSSPFYYCVFSVLVGDLLSFFFTLFGLFVFKFSSKIFHLGFNRYCHKNTTKKRTITINIRIKILRNISISIILFPLFPITIITMIMLIININGMIMILPSQKCSALSA